VSLPEKTVARLFNADTLGDIQQSFGAITEELGRQYSLGYYPKGQARAGERRDIKVRVRIPTSSSKRGTVYVANATAPAPGRSRLNRFLFQRLAGADMPVQMF